MADIDSLLNRWQTAGVLDAQSVSRIRTWESERKRPAGLRWQGLLALILGAILLASGVALFVSAHWDELGPVARLAIVFLMVALFHGSGALTRASFHGLSTTLHAVGTASTGAAIALIGQIFNIQEHWPAAVLLWALAAIAGWILLRDQVQQTLALLLVPAWMFSELSFYTDHHIGQQVYLGRFLVAWGILYLTFFIGSKHKVLQGILFAAAAVASLLGIVLVLQSWTTWFDQAFIPLSTRLWAWALLALVPLTISLFRYAKSLLPVTAAIALTLALPWCTHTWTEIVDHGAWRAPFTHTDPNIASYILVAAFAIFVALWGVRLASRALVNLGVVGFAITVCWFYFGDLFDKVGRSLGLIGMGVLFLAGGWALEKARRRLMAHLATQTASIAASIKEAQ